MFLLVFLPVSIGRLVELCNVLNATFLLKLGPKLNGSNFPKNDKLE